MSRDYAAVAEQLEVQLAGCATAASGWNQNPAKQGDYGWSPAYQDVLDLRRRMEALEVALNLAINTVECASLDKDGKTELPWYRTAKKALAR